MLLAFIAAFFLPNRVSDRGRANVQSLFAPVAVPTRWAAGLLHGAVWPARATDQASPEQPRELANVYQENDELRVLLANVRGQLEHYKARAAEREELGQVSDRCSRYTVMGGDPGPRDSLAIIGFKAGSLQTRMVALTRDCIIGRIDRVGTGGAQVLLMTDKQSKFTGTFGRYQPDAEGKPVFRRFDLPPTLVQGSGQSVMRSELMQWKDVESAGLKENDWLVLDDTAWPDALRWYRVGRVVSVKQSRQSILFAEVLIRPTVDATQLREVMVMDK